MAIQRVLAAVLIVLALSGCSTLVSKTRWAPIPTIAEFDTFRSRLQLTGAGASPTPAQFRVSLIEYIGEMHGYAAEKRSMEWENSGLAAYGGMAAVLGALADRTGLLNTGAAVAGFGLANSSRYNFGQQAIIYVTAVKKLSCISNKVAFVPDSAFADARETDDPAAAVIAKGAIDTLIVAVETVRIESINSMMSLAPPSPTRDDYLSMFNMYRPGSPGANAAPNPDPNIQRKRDAAEQIKVLLTDVGVCTKA